MPSCPATKSMTTVGTSRGSSKNIPTPAERALSQIRVLSCLS
ncbi:hypothetical protein ACTMTF_42400 [Nonomuraea sp. ZG12]